MIPLTARGFTDRDLWRYLARPLTDLPPRPDLEVTVTRRGSTARP